MSYLPKILGAVALYFAAGAVAQTIDLPAIFVDTTQKCLDMNVTEKIPATMKVLDGKTNNASFFPMETHVRFSCSLLPIQSSAALSSVRSSLEIG